MFRNLTDGLEISLLSCLIVGLWRLLIHSAYKAWFVKFNDIHQSAALLYSADSLQVLEDGQRVAGFDWRSCYCNSNLAELHFPAQTFSAWKSNSLSRPLVCFMISFQGQQSTKIQHQIEISTLWEKLHLCSQNDGWQKIKPWDGRKLGRTFTDWIIWHLELLYSIGHDSFPIHRVLLLFRIRSLLIIKSPSWRLNESDKHN